MAYSSEDVAAPRGGRPTGAGRRLDPGAVPDPHLRDPLCRAADRQGAVLGPSAGPGRRRSAPQLLRGGALEPVAGDRPGVLHRRRPAGDRRRRAGWPAARQGADLLLGTDPASKRRGGRRRRHPGLRRHLPRRRLHRLGRAADDLYLRPVQRDLDPPAQHGRGALVSGPGDAPGRAHGDPQRAQRRRRRRRDDQQRRGLQPAGDDRRPGHCRPAAERTFGPGSASTRAPSHSATT